VALLPGDTQILSGSYDHTMKLWNIESPPGLKIIGNAHSNLVVSGDGKRIVSAGYYLPGTGHPPGVRVWDAATGKELLALKAHKFGIMMRSVAVSADGGRIVSSDSSGRVIVWDAAKDYKPRILPHNFGENAIALSPDAKRVAADKNWLVHICDADTGQIVRVLKGHQGAIGSIVFIANSNRMVTGSADNTVMVWDINTGKAVVTLAGHTGNITSVAALPDGKRIVSGSRDKTAKVWDEITGEEIATLKGHTADITSVAILPDGKRVVTGGDDQTVRIWDATTGHETLTLKATTFGTMSVAVSRDGKRIYAATLNSIDVFDAGLMQNASGDERGVARSDGRNDSGK
jgi:WD40 repeat protein